MGGGWRGGGRSCYLTFTTVKEEVVVAVNGDARNTVALLLFCRNIKRIKKGLVIKSMKLICTLP